MVHISQQSKVFLNKIWSMKIQINAKMQTVSDLGENGRVHQGCLLKKKEPCNSMDEIYLQLQMVAAELFRQGELKKFGLPHTCPILQ